MFIIEVFTLVMLNIFLLLILDEFTNDKAKFTLISLCIFFSTISTIISIIVFLKNNKNK